MISSIDLLKNINLSWAKYSERLQYDEKQSEIQEQQLNHDRKYIYLNRNIQF